MWSSDQISHEIGKHACEMGTSVVGVELGHSKQCKGTQIRLMGSLGIQLKQNQMQIPDQNNTFCCAHSASYTTTP